MTELGFNYIIPDLLVGKVRIGEPYRNHNAKGYPTSFGLDIDCVELNLSKSLKSTDFHLLRGKLDEALTAWEVKYQRHLDRQHKEYRAESVDQLNSDAKEALDDLRSLLEHTLDIDDAVDWNAIKRKDKFRVKPEQLFSDGNLPEFIQFNSHGRPTGFSNQALPEKPTLERVKSDYGFLSRLFRGKTIEEDLRRRLDQWRSSIEQVDKENANRQEHFAKSVSDYDEKKAEFDAEKRRDNDIIESIKERYNNADPTAVEEYCDLVLNGSEYPDYFPKNWILEYREDSRIAVIEYKLPAPGRLPTIDSYKYIKARDEIAEKHISRAEQKALYDSVVYQICVRTIHELFEADTANALDAVAFNGLVTSTNPATGVEETKAIMSVLAKKEAFMEFDLSQVDPKATFRHLRGIAAIALSDLTPIPPIIKLDKSDKRFISGRDIVAGLDESVNLAAMHWDDFEHLIRELFEEEFTGSGGEVKVTQASSDGGVDAIAFDPDPIRGGKIVIQAKRYTNVVGVAAVRDLYGTVMNEGATKGILVTTSDYGRDSYEFAKDKPITLLNGNNLLSLLEKHGHKARINVAEAKKIMKG
ncbi:MAG: restriction endonuclease [Candidatus Eisenbacteria bacterium]|uniref:Restriction endonuclease n=1 Tax=Eiseniibacteriota bacterium TaxID=2212470 RepID=A0A948RXZ0_UNCEI|nr:restriction endonuclease [Candidatus Eisenbacteria bacterium]MBU1947555.1 restriction endonuclease [Candidatus Eisenbacteria bacterium]MBU2691649.1 restriction endonuclease [Candidatus Eisenbacteria bacterium]